MNIREIANLGATDLFGIVQIGLYIVFVAVIIATPFIVAKRFNVDLIALIKKWMARSNENKNKRGPRANERVNDNGFFDKEHRSEKICENRICDKNAGEHGAVIKHQNGSRKIVCAECAAAYLKTGYTLELSWGEEFLSGYISLIFVGAATNVLNPTPVLATPTFIVFCIITTVSLLWVSIVLRRRYKK